MIVKNSNELVSVFNNIFGKCIIEEKVREISIEELEENGKGKINIIIKKGNKALKIKPNDKINIGCIKKPNKPDGIVFEINFKQKKIIVYLVELKKNLLSKLEKAIEQLSKAYWFVKSLSLEECFDMEFVLILGYKDELNEQNLELFRENEPNLLLREAYNAIYEKYKNRKNIKFPVKLPFCKFKLLNFELKKMEDII
ncbi:MAG: hypothetical protein ABGX26_06370 [Nautiliaceae bacterium]